MSDTPSLPALTPQDWEEIEKQASKINPSKEGERNLFRHPSGRDPNVPHLVNGYSDYKLIYYYAFPDGGTLEVDPAIFDQVYAELLAQKGIEQKSLHTLMEEAKQRWERQRYEAAKLEMAIDFWKTFPARGVYFFPGKPSSCED